MMFLSLLIATTCLTGANAYWLSEKKWTFLLPSDVIKELIELDANSTTDPVGVDQAIDAILRNQSTKILDQLDLPPYYERLPFVQRWQIKDILFDRQLTYQQKHQMIYDLIHKLPIEQQKFPPVNSAQHSRYFEAFSTLQYQIGFTFKLSELKLALPPRDMQMILHVIANPQIEMEEKLIEIERVMSRQSFEILDRLFFTGVPIIDAEVRERFRRLFVQKNYWNMPPVTKIHPNCMIKPFCNLKFGPKDGEDKGYKKQIAQMDPINGQQQKPDVKIDKQMNPINGQMDSTVPETSRSSFVIEVQAGNAKPIKQEIPLDPLNQMSTIVVESQTSGAGNAPKVNVFVQNKNGSESNSDETKSQEPVFGAGKAIKITPTLQNPSPNLAWSLPIGFDDANKQKGFSAAKLGSYSSPTRLSVVRNGAWTHQDERTFLRKWYNHFGIAMGGGIKPVEKKPEEPVPLEKFAESVKDDDLNVTTPANKEQQMDMPSTMSPATEAHIEVLRAAHEKQETENKSTPKMSDPVQIALQSETIKPPTIVINKEAKEKLVVRHSIKGSTLHLEKMSSAELREADASINNTSTNDKQADVSENDEPTDLLKQPLNDSGLELIDSIVNDGQKNETENLVETKEEIPSGLLKLRDALRRLRERIRQMPFIVKNETFS